MKKVVAGAAAFLAAVAPCSMFFASIEPVRASAENLMLTKEETRALFSDHIYCNYTVSANFTNEMSFDFYGYGSIGDFDSTPSANSIWYDPSDQDCVIYRGSQTPTIPFYDTNNIFNIKIFPVIDLSGLTNIQFSSGLSTNGSYSLESFTYNNYQNYKPYFKMFIDNSLTQGSRSPFYISGSRYCPVAVEIDAGSLTTHYYSSLAQFSYSQNTEFRAFCSGDGSSGFSQKYGVSPATNAIDSGFGQYYYLFISTVQLSSGYVNNIPQDSSSDGGSDSGSGSDYPDYSGDLQDIIDRLDAIVDNGYVIDGALDDLIDIGQGVHGDLQGVNSRLDQANSTLNQIDSHIQGLQIPDLMSQSSGDMSHIAQNESKNNSDLRAADANQQVINSVAGYGDVSLPNLDNVHSMPDDFSELWNYTDQDGLSWVNPILYAMPILTLTVGALAYIVFGRAR